ncbi:PH domain-containing protein [Geodermatophilus sp. SYSU D00705]
MAAPVRMRMSRTALLPVVLLLVCAVPLAFAATWTLVVLLVPLLVAAWVLRVGVDVSDDAVTVRSMVGQRRVPWSELAGIRVGRRNDLWLVTTGGTEVRLPVLRTRDLPRLAALSGGRIPSPDPAA